MPDGRRSVAAEQKRVQGWHPAWQSYHVLHNHSAQFWSQVQEIISDNCVVIFSKTTCFYCKMAKKLFEGMNVNYTAVELDMNTNGSQFQDILEQMTGGRTVPRVFVNGTFVGGATETQRLHEEGRLLPLVHQCQVKRKS
ncbi:glutaredoxin 2 isoform X3 [Calonectris borealis]|uniref:glutaredoxin 2 isoform X3 n=1 Tax=Calonectris borealis TaxID=1323832 RepID=UPI003F4C6C42